MTFYKILLHDINRGLHRRRYLFLPVAYLIPQIGYYFSIKSLSSRGTWIDVFAFLLKGNIPISALYQSGKRIPFPSVWFYIFTCSILVGFDYIQDDLTINGQQIIVRCSSRKQWFESKCIWCIFNSIVTFSSLLVSVFAFSAAIGVTFSISPTPTIWEHCLGIESIESFPSLFFILCCLVLPFISLMTINFLGMICSLFFKPIIGFLLCESILILAVWKESNYILACSGMILRNLYQNDNYEIVSNRITPALFILIVCAIAGEMRIQKFDILPGDEHP